MPEEVVKTGTDNAVATAPESSAIASLEKVAAAAPSAADPNAPIVPQGAGAGTTVQPGQPGANVGAQGDPAKGVAGEDAAWMGIPEERRNVILDNTRKKEREAVTAELMKDLGWAKGVDVGAVRDAFSFAERIAADPVAFAAQLISEIRQTPELAAALDKQLGGDPALRQIKREMPKPRLKADDGTLAYSSDQVLEILQNFKAELLDEVGGRVGPLEDFRGSLEEREEVMNIIHESRTESQQLLGEMRQHEHWPKPDASGKNPGEAKIAAYLEAIPKAVKDRIGAVASMYQAYNTFLQKDVFPALGSRTEQEVRDNLRRKAAAGTGTVGPGAPAPQGAPKLPTNPEELARHMEKLAGAVA